MFASVFRFCLGCLLSLFLAANTVFWFFLLCLTVPLILLGYKAWYQGLVGTARIWQHANRLAIGLIRTNWHIDVPDNLSRDENVILLCNHQSFVDPFVYSQVFSKTLPLPRWMVKKSVLAIPIFGLGAYFANFIAINRYTPEFLAKHPERREDNKNIIRRVSQRLKVLPFCLIVYPEGTRRTEEKAKNLPSDFEQLLNPKVGGLAIFLEHVEVPIHRIIDCNIYFSPKPVSLFSFFCGNVTDVYVKAREITVPESLGQVKYEESEAARDQYREWIRSLWKDKDQVLTQLAERAQANSKATA